MIARARARGRPGTRERPGIPAPRERNVTGSGDRRTERASRSARSAARRDRRGWPGRAALKARDDDLAGEGNGLRRAASTVVLGRPAAVLASLIAEITFVRRGVSDVARPHVMHDGLADLRETGGEPMDEHEDQEHPHDAVMLHAPARAAQTTTRFREPLSGPKRSPVSLPPDSAVATDCSVAGNSVGRGLDRGTFASAKIPRFVAKRARISLRTGCTSRRTSRSRPAPCSCCQAWP